MRTLVTVDFDFFVPEEADWDLGHQENLLFLKMLWGTRGGLIDKMRTTGEEKGFWKLLRGQGRFKRRMWVSDSHLYAFVVSVGFDRVVSFDAHHDCWESSRKGSVMCDDWLRVWLEEKKGRRATWVRPDWLKKGLCELPKDMTGRVDVVHGLKGLDLGLDGLVSVHVCRSGCWVPPWLDGAFSGFVEGFGGGLDKVVKLQDGEWDPMEERWTPKDLQDARESEARVRTMLSGMAVGEVSSGDFAKGMREEQKVGR